MRENTNQEKYIAFNLYDTYDGDRNKMFSDIGIVLDILTKNNYQCAFKHEDAGVHILEFDYDDPDLGTPTIYWLNNDQVDCLYTSEFIGEKEEDE